MQRSSVRRARRRISDCGPCCAKSVPYKVGESIVDWAPMASGKGHRSIDRGLARGSDRPQRPGTASIISLGRDAGASAYTLEPSARQRRTAAARRPILIKDNIEAGTRADDAARSRSRTTLRIAIARCARALAGIVIPASTSANGPICAVRAPSAVGPRSSLVKNPYVLDRNAWAEFGQGGHSL